MDVGSGQQSHDRRASEEMRAREERREKEELQILFFFCF